MFCTWSVNSNVWWISFRTQRGTFAEFRTGKLTNVGHHGFLIYVRIDHLLRSDQLGNREPLFGGGHSFGSIAQRLSRIPIWPIRTEPGGACIHEGTNGNAAIPVSREISNWSIWDLLFDPTEQPLLWSTGYVLLEDRKVWSQWEFGMCAHVCVCVREGKKGTRYYVRREVWSGTFGASYWCKAWTEYRQVHKCVYSRIQTYEEGRKLRYERSSILWHASTSVGMYTHTYKRTYTQTATETNIPPGLPVRRREDHRGHHHEQTYTSELSPAN